MPMPSDPVAQSRADGIRLYGHPASRAHRTMWMLKELGLEFEHIPTGFTDGSTRQPEFLRINPNGRVPVLETPEITLVESMAINLYLARRYPGPLSPQTIEEEAFATQWSFWVVTEIEKPLIVATANTILFAPESRSAEEFEVMFKKLARPLGVLDKVLTTQPYLLGDRFTVADLNVSVVMTLMRLAKMDLSAWPAVDRWLTDCLERPAAADWKAVSFSVPRPPSHLAMLASFV